jgi:intracellular sulfur oxidation DsrE/DsrF family protein
MTDSFKLVGISADGIQCLSRLVEYISECEKKTKFAELYRKGVTFMVCVAPDLENIVESNKERLREALGVPVRLQ